MTILVIDGTLTWQEVAAIADGATPQLSDAARRRIEASRAIVEAIVDRGIVGYGINTGVGALCDVAVDRAQQGALSRNILMSHSCGVGTPLGTVETRAIMAAQINNFAHGMSGVRLDIVEGLRTLLGRNCLPRIPSRGSLGYLTHAAAIGLVLIGQGEGSHDGQLLSGGEALARAGLAPLVLQAKEGLSLVNGTPCATGLACVALARLQLVLDWADAAAAMSYESLGHQAGAFDEASLALRPSAALQRVARTLRDYLDGSALLATRSGAGTQDALSLRAIPQVHGAVRDVFDQACTVVDRELGSVTDNPAIAGTMDAPRIYSGAQAVAVALGLALDQLAIAAADLGAISERRIDRLVNPLVSGLPAFLAADNGVRSGFMIAQYTASALVAENRRLASPASLDGGITSALQEDFISHATPAATKLLTVIDNVRDIMLIELLAAAQAYDVQNAAGSLAPRTAAIHRRIREVIPVYSDDRPLNGDFTAMRTLMQAPPVAEPAEAIRAAPIG